MRLKAKPLSGSSPVSAKGYATEVEPEPMPIRSVVWRAAVAADEAERLERRADSRRQR